MKMVEIDVVKDEQAARLANAAGLRNQLSHRYLDYKWPAIQSFFKDDMQTVMDFLNRCESLALGPDGTNLGNDTDG